MTKPNFTEIIVILDRSGSMSTIAADMRGGFDQFIADQRKVPGECTVTLAQFDDRYELVYEARPIADVPPLELVPRGWTALYDAVGKTINSVGERLSKTPEDARPSKVIVVIISDGHENRSQEFGQPAIAEMIKVQRETYNWEFVYLGANQIAADVAVKMGIPARAAVTYQTTRSGTRGATQVLSASIASARACASPVAVSQADYEKAVAEVEAQDTDKPARAIKPTPAVRRS